MRQKDPDILGLLTQTNKTTQQKVYKQDGQHQIRPGKIHPNAIDLLAEDEAVEIFCLRIIEPDAGLTESAQEREHRQPEQQNNAEMDRRCEPPDTQGPTTGFGGGGWIGISHEF